ncbi:MAG: hypothetical protein CMK07_07500 [Ponticaulis sp.]|nr:hypothetical protein [Ponticaulis sp.]
MVRESIDERFHHPFAEVIGGENSVLRAKLLGAMLLGISISQKTSQGFKVDETVRDALKGRIADIVALAIKPI